MRILVTGCCGFIGSHIYNKLILNGHDVHGIDDLSGGTLNNARLEFGENYPKNDITVWPLEDSDSLTAAGYFKPDICFHVAASAREIGSLYEPLYSTQKNFWAYMNLLNALIKHKCKKVILFSSMAVYGDGLPPFKETDRRQPADVYGINKFAMERCTEVLSKIHGFDYTIIRPHNVFGERQSLCDKYRNFIAIWMNRIMREETMHIFGDGTQRRAPSYIDFSLPCYLRCIEECNGEIINIGGMKDYSINQMARMTIDAMTALGWKEPNVEHLPPRPNEVKNAWTTFDKSVELLGYEETMPVEWCIQQMAAWASSMGPQEWTEDKLELWAPGAPEIWK
jgi:UDP-glucose 4-epimerase